MATKNLSISYRPVRIGFLVRQDNIEDIINAVGINTLLCGGIFNPIVPVSANNRLAEELIKIFNVDVLYPVAQDESIISFQEKYPYLRSPDLYAREIFHGDYRTQKQKIAYLDVLNLIEHYWERDLKHKSKKYKTNCALVTWTEDDPLINLFSVSLGYFPIIYNLQDDFRDAFLNGLHSKLIELTPSESVSKDLINCIFPLRFTSSELTGYGGTFQRDGLYIGDENNFTDLCAFWNLRAAGLALRFLPKNHISRCEEFIKAHLKVLDARPNHPPHIEDHIFIHYQPRDQWIGGVDQEIVEITKRFKTKKRLIFSTGSEFQWNGLQIKAATYNFGFDSTLIDVEDFYDKYRVVLNLQQKPDIIDNASSEIQGQKVVVSIRPYVEGSDYPNHTLRPPFIQKLNEVFSRDIAFDPWSLTTEPEGIGIIIGASEKYETLYPLAHQNMIEHIFKYVEIDTSISQAGLITKRILEKLNSDMGIGGSVFRVKGVRDLLESLKADECIDRGEATKRIWANEQFKKYQARWKNPASVFDSLLKREFFRAGLELQCDHCRLNCWLSLKDIDDFWTCAYCGKKHQMSLHLRNRGDWKFRKSGLFAKDNNQEGAIPVILTLLTLAETFDWYNLVYTPSMNLKFDSTNCETDFCVMQYQKGNSIELGIGECKSQRGKIELGDIENLKAVRNKFKGTEIESYLVFAKTADQFDSEEIELFKDLAKDNVPCVLFLNRELESDRHGDSRDDVPNKYPFTFRDLAINSYHRYVKTQASIA